MIYESHTCGACGGNGAFWPDAHICVKCEGSGEVVACLGECGSEIPEPEAFREGHFCRDCRETLDHKESAA